MMLPIYLVLIVVFSFLLIKASDILLVNLKSVSERTRLGKFAITSFFLALATSLPELFVGVASALSGKPSLSLGNIIGANVANLSLVIGGAALVGGLVNVQGTFLRRDVFYTFLAGAAPMLLLVDKSLSRIDGLILLALYGFYQVMVFGEKKRQAVSQQASEQLGEEDFPHRLLRQMSHRGTKKEIGWTFLSVALLLFAADMIVRLASKIALALNLPLMMIGLVIVAIGTTLPELAFSLKAVKDHQPSMVFGTLLGSIVTNSTLIIGVVALIAPVRIEALAEYLLATLAFVIAFGLFYYFIRTKHQLERWEGAFLLGFYLSFVFSEFIHP